MSGDFTAVKFQVKASDDLRPGAARQRDGYERCGERFPALEREPIANPGQEQDQRRHGGKDVARHFCARKREKAKDN